MFHKYRIVSMLSIALFCALAVFAFSATPTLAAQNPVPGTPTTQKPPAQQQKPPRSATKASNTTIGLSTNSPFKR